MICFLFVAIIIPLFWNVHSFGISKGDDIVTLKKVAAGYKLFMPENNHDVNFERALFSISTRDSSYHPEIQNDIGFKFRWENYRTTWTLYAESNFDYETQKRTYIIEVKLGPQLKTFTLYIENIDDEPPSIDCSGVKTFIDNINSTLQNSSCGCLVSDPDGFLSRMTFSLIGTHAEVFEMGFPENIPDIKQSANVKIANIKKLDHNLFAKALLTVVAKDGAGHNTIPTANVAMEIQISHYD